ncbi:MAG TPA: PAS domain S-box protein [Candidatus Cloacimonetes bacterium]|nr:PAS domain S-box protein [Candidatus Cloacimonadota bacterium]HEX37330.1 PAS domain S-box protein [Candidatus Cloacimonadota bacterium]
MSSPNSDRTSITTKKLLPISIMYVEDETIILRSVSTMLKRKIKDVYIAKNGQEGLELFKKYKPNIVVTDIKMPIINGLEMIEQMKDIEPATKFVVVSAYGETNYFLRAIEIGVHGFILKPVDVNQLMEIIKDLANNILLQQEIEQKEKQRKEAEQARISTEKQYHILYENMRDGSVRTDLKGRILDCNIAFQKILGYSRDELIGKKTRSLTPQKWHDYETNIIKTQVQKQGYSELYEKEYFRKDGTVFPVECRTYLQKDEAGNMMGYWGIIRDITIRKQSEEALKKSEEKFRNLFENANDVIWISDEKGKYISVNKMFEQLLGYSKEELEGQQSIKIIANEDRKKSIENYQKALKGESVEFETSIVKKDGTERIFWIKMRPVFDGGKLLYLQGIGRDITDRKEAEKALQEQKAYFQQLFESSPEAIVVATNDSRVLQLNQTFIDMFGFSQEEAIGKNIDELIAENNYKDEAHKITQSIAEGETVRLETQRMRKDGTIIDVSILGTPIIIEGKQVAVYGIYRDITNRKQAERELKKSYERLQKLIEDTVNVLAHVVELRDPYTAGHQHNVAKLALAIANEMNLSEDKINGIRIGGTMHDIGKIKVPIKVLNKVEMLTDNEWQLIKNHPEVGYELLKDLEFPWPVADIVRQHHERFNGSGYPQGLKNEDTLIEARILAVADVVEAMANDRPYRQSLGMEIALEEIEDNKGILYDPEVVEHAVRILKDGTFKFDQKHTE